MSDTPINRAQEIADERRRDRIRDLERGLAAATERADKLQAERDTLRRQARIIAMWMQQGRVCPPPEVGRECTFPSGNCIDCVLTGSLEGAKKEVHENRSGFLVGRPRSAS